MDKDFPPNFPLPEEYLLELGRIFALWGSLEAIVNQAIVKLSGIREESEWRISVLTAHSSFQQRLDVINTLCDQLKLEHPNLASSREAMNAAQKAQILRNHYAHNQLFPNDDGTVSSAKISARGKLKLSVTPVKVDDLSKVSADIHLALIAIHKLVTGVEYAPVWERE